MKHRSLCFLLVMIMITSYGCGGSGRGLRVEYVEGVVTLDGTPVAGASLSFIPTTEDGKMEVAGGYTNEKGVYKLSSMNGDPERGAVEGDYKVIVTKIESKSLKDPNAPYYSGGSGYHATYSQKHLLPEIYRDRDNTPVAAHVKKGNNKINIELKSAP